MLLTAEEKVHIIWRRRFAEDLRRHFAGQVVSASDTLLRIRGYSFLFNSGRNEWVRRPERREIVLALAGGDAFITLMPPAVDLEALRYTLIAGRLMLVDGAGFELDINEFSFSR